MNFCFVNSQQKKKFKKELGKKIRYLRNLQKISQAQLAFESKLSREQILRVEQGGKNATIDTLLAISEALDIPIKDLFDF